MKVLSRRLTGIFLVLLMTLSIIPTFAATAFADVDTCTVTFIYDENNRTLDVTVAVDAGGQVGQPTTPARAGYQFLGWYDQADQAFDFANTVISADITLIAYWASGTEDDPYLIGDMDSLRWMQAAFAGSEAAIYRTQYYVLTADIVSDGADFNPMSGTFSGVFDGQGHTVTGLTISGGSGDNGLFATVSGTIKNLGLAEITVNPTSRVGAIAGQTSGAFTIENCYATGRINGGVWYTGGLVGYSYAGGGRISNCYFSGSVISGDRSPGNYPSATYGVGGIAGYAYGTVIENCYSAGSVTGDVTGNSTSALGVGGILGDSRQNTTVQKCFSTTAVKGYDDVGGILGALNYGSVADCVALNSIVWATRSGTYGNVGRINGLGHATTSYAWEGTQVIGVRGNYQNQGTPLSIAEINTAAGWPPVFSSGAWSYTNGQLPTLSGLSGQDGTMPDWLRPLEAGMNWRVAIFYDDGVTATLFKDVADQGTVQPPDDPVRSDYKFMGWYELGATEAFDFASPITANVYLFANWAAPGTAANPYLIASMDDLRWMANMVNSSNTTYRRAYYDLTEDLVYDGQGFNAMLPLTGSGGVPQLNYDYAFMGQLDGAGHTVTGLPINGQGLFGFIYGGAVKNLGLIDVTVNGAGNHPYVGAIAGYLASGVTYQGVHYGVSTGLIENCYVVNGNVSGAYTVGGLVGHSSEAICAIKNSYFRGKVTGTDNVGGIAGNNNGIIENTYTAGSVEGDTVGGIAGSVSTGAALTNSYSRSAVIGGSNAGGLVGAAAGDVYLATCLALNPYVQATTAETGRAGCVVGDLDAAGVVIDCYSWEDTTVSAAVTETGENGFALSTEYIKDGSGIPEVFTLAPWAYTVGQLPILAGLGPQESGFDPGAVTRGDVNGDGVIDFDDVLDALNHYLGTALLESDGFQAADVNMDGVVDFDDVLDILNHYLGVKLLDN